MIKNRFEQNKEDSWKIAAIIVSILIIVLLIGMSITLFDKEINDNIPHRSIVITNDGEFVTIIGTTHKYDGQSYLKLKRIVKLPSLSVNEKTVQRMAEELDRHELYFNKQIRSK